MTNLDQQSFIPPTIRVLGTNSDGNVLVWATDQKRLYRIENIDSLTYARIVQIAGITAYLQAYSEVKSALGKDAKVPETIRTAIADLSRTRLFNVADSIGQGIWRLAGTEDVILIAGNSATRVQTDHESETITLTDIVEPVVGSRLIELGGQQWTDPGTLFSELGQALTTEQVWDELAAALSCWQFKIPGDRIVVAGMLVATAIQAALEFRPQVWVCGPTNCGKTALLEFIRRMWPWACCKNNVSQAGLYQAIERDSLPLLLDEQEPSRHRQRLLELFRNSSRGGSVCRGTPSGKSREYVINHIAWLFSIDAGLDRAADSNRFAVLELETPEQIRIPDASVLQVLGRRLVMSAVVCIDPILRTWAELVRNPDLAQYGRLVEVYGVPLAAYAVMTGRAEHAVQLLDELLAAKAKTLDSESDEQDVLRTILTFVPKGATSPVAKMLKSGWDEQTLMNIGIRKKPNGDIFIAHKILQQELPKTGKWADANLYNFLARLPNAKGGEKYRINGVPVNGVVVPLDVLLPPDNDDIPF